MQKSAITEFDLFLGTYLIPEDHVDKNPIFEYGKIVVVRVFIKVVRGLNIIPFCADMLNALKFSISAKSFKLSNAINSNESKYRFIYRFLVLILFIRIFLQALVHHGKYVVNKVFLQILVVIHLLVKCEMISNE